jgi:hypothetical protein
VRVTSNGTLALLSAGAVGLGLLIAALSLPARETAVHHPASKSDAPAPQATAVAVACKAVSFTGKAGAIASPGATVRLTAAASGCPSPLYRFWVLEPGSRWSMVQDYSLSASYQWTPPATMGDYTFEVDVRDASQTTAYDAIANAVFKVAGCTSASVSTDRSSPQRPGTKITLRAAASCPSAASYRFWIRPPGGDWRVVRDYASQSTFAWIPDGAGTYDLEVDVRDARSSARYEAVANLRYPVT